MLYHNQLGFVSEVEMLFLQPIQHTGFFLFSARCLISGTVCLFRFLIAMRMKSVELVMFFIAAIGARACVLSYRFNFVPFAF